jgi:hypothetical protein
MRLSCNVLRANCDSKRHYMCFLIPGAIDRQKGELGKASWQHEKRVCARWHLSEQLVTERGLVRADWVTMATSSLSQADYIQISI